MNQHVQNDELILRQLLLLLLLFGMMMMMMMMKKKKKKKLSISFITQVGSLRKPKRP